MSALYDPRVSAACLALREAPPGALDAAILRHAREAIAATTQASARAQWRRRTFAVIVAFIGVLGATNLFERPAAPARPSPAAAARIAPTVPVMQPAVPSRPAAAAPRSVATAHAKPRARTPTRDERRTEVRKASDHIVPEPRPAASTEGVEVKAMPAIDAMDAEPTPIAPLAPAPALDGADPASERCVADPLDPSCTPPQ